MKSKILYSIVILFFITTLGLLCEYEKPYSPGLAGTTFQLQKNWWVRLFHDDKGGWILENLNMNLDTTFNWASWGCHSLGIECRAEDHCARWSIITMGPDWEPPLPAEQGNWERIDYDEVPLQYDLINDIYY